MLGLRSWSRVDGYFISPAKSLHSPSPVPANITPTSRLRGGFEGLCSAAVAAFAVPGSAAFGASDVRISYSRSWVCRERMCSP